MLGTIGLISVQKKAKNKNKKKKKKNKNKNKTKQKASQSCTGKDETKKRYQKTSYSQKTSY